MPMTRRSLKESQEDSPSRPVETVLIVTKKEEITSFEDEIRRMESYAEEEAKKPPPKKQKLMEQKRRRLVPGQVEENPSFLQDFIVEIKQSDEEEDIEDDDSTPNPWTVPDASEFLKYCCPECDKKCSLLDDFSKHAVESHPRSKSLFLPGGEVTEDLAINDDDFQSSRLQFEHSYTNDSVFSQERPQENTSSDQTQPTQQQAPILAPIGQFNPQLPFIILPFQPQMQPQIINPPNNEASPSVSNVEMAASILKSDGNSKSKKIAKLVAYKMQEKGIPIKKLISNVTNSASETPSDMVIHNPNAEYDEAEKVYKCSKCPEGEKFRDKIQVMHHWLTGEHNGKNVRFSVCQWCFEVFNNQTEFEMHLRVHHKKILAQKCIGYPCKICNDKQMRSLSELRNHYVAAHDTPDYSPYTCKKCLKPFLLEEELLRHENGKHGANHEEFDCDKCPLEFHLKGLYLVHYLSHDPEMVFYLCTYCNDAFHTQKELVEHCRELHHNNAFPVYICERCDFSHKSFKPVEVHVKSEHGEEFKPYKCKMCEFTTINNINLRKHNDRHNPPALVCDACAESFPSERAVMLHKRFKHANVERKYDHVCDRCGYSTYDKELLTNHVWKKHSVEKHKKCPHCEKILPFPCLVEEHIDKKHPETGEKKHFCDKCKIGFIFAYSLRAHKNKHKKNPKYKARNPVKKKLSKKFGCTVCSKQFLKLRNMKKHMMDAHQINAYEHHCAKCGKGYDKEHNCRKKQAPTHDCLECNLKYANAQGLQEHIISQHSTFIY